MQEKIVSIGEFITVGELADMLNLPVTTLIGELFKNGIAATINQKIDFETATIIIEELGIDAKLEKKTTSINDNIGRSRYEISDNAVERPPIVAVMGHVDHGKTSLLDALLDTKVVDGEAGGITQHISAYQTTRGSRVVTLLDTPGHEAFAALRQHGAILTDVVIIVVAADDGVSAKKKINLDKLMDTVLLVADMEELKADIDVPGRGLVIEAHKEVGKGSVVSLLIEQGQLSPGKFLVAGTTYGKIRTLLNYKNEAIRKAGPSTPVTVTGFKELPQFGDIFVVAKNEKDARHIAQKSKLEQEKAAASTNVTGADLLKMMNQQYDSQEFNVIVKADVQGSLTSVMDSLRLVDTGGAVNLHIIGSGVGDISENDIRLAADEKTVIYGFNVDLPPAVKRLAVRDGVNVRLYKIIYELLDDAKRSMEDMLAPEVVENKIGELDIKGVFRITKTEAIVGGEVVDGKVYAGLLVRIKRDNDVVSEAEIEKVQRQQQEAKEVFAGEMCGISLKTSKKIHIEEGDKLEFFTRELVKRTLG